jgi:predicted HTH domain antitoxin
MNEAIGPPIALEQAIALYASQTVTQGQAAALAGMSRAEFIDALNKVGVSVFQYDSPDELIKEIPRSTLVVVAED